MLNIRCSVLDISHTVVKFRLKYIFFMNTIRTMKQFFLIFILFILPLQISWAAIAVYCQHETGTGVGHFGHHTHEHKVSKDENKKENLSGKIDRDCAYCNLGHIGFFAFSADLSSIALPLVHSPNHDHLVTLIPPDRPERPDWNLAV